MPTFTPAAPPPPRHAAAWGLLAPLALVKLGLHLATTGAFGYEFFVDELYFMATAGHLAWGYVDMPPLIPFATAVIRFLLGDSLLAVRPLPALAGAALVILTGLLARDLGGGRFAQGIGALAVITAPIYLVMHSFHSMNAVEPLLWTGCAWLLARIATGAPQELWLPFGLLAGVGFLNKHTMALFGLALVAGVLSTPLRSALRAPWFLIGGAIAFAVTLPNLLWMISQDFPHLEMLANIRENQRNVSLTPLEFIGQQILMLHPASLPLWAGGLAWLLAGREGRPFRALGLAYLAVMALLLLLDGRVYYPAPAYPMLFAAGGVALERWTASRRGALARPSLLRGAYAGILAAAGAVIAPLWLPALPPQTFTRYSQALGMSQPRIETHRLGPLPQLLADRFGWREMAEEVARIHRTLPPEERAEAAVFGQNYGQAGAIDLYGPSLGLPKAISGHLAYHDWGPRGATGEVMIVMDDDREILERLFDSVEWAGEVRHPYSMPYQQFDVFVCRGLRTPLTDLWPRLRHLD